MEELKKALETRRKFNKMDFDEFVKLLENHIGEEIPKKEKDNFKFTGLMNVDLFTMWVDF